jgi:hypothetical protein
MLKHIFILQSISPARQAADRTQNSRFRFKNTTKTRKFTGNFIPIVNLGQTARSVAREKWREIPPDPTDRMPAEKIDRVLAIGYLCGFESDCQSWSEYLKVWEGAA